MADAQKKGHTKPVCSHCGSDEIMFDAWSAWSEEDQVYELVDSKDEAFCGACDGEASVKWIDV